MKLLAIPSSIAEKIAGKVTNSQAIDPVYIGTFNGIEWYILNFDTLKNLALKLKDNDLTRFQAIKDRFQAKIDDGTIKVFDTEDGSNLAQRYAAIKNETEEESTARIATRQTMWNSTKEITI